MEFNKILIAVDDSAYSMKAAQTGFQLAHRLKAAIGIVYVVDRSQEVSRPDLGISEQQQHTFLLQEAEQTIKQYVELYDGIDKIFRFTPEGDPKKEIINIAKQWDADMIVVGTHGRSGLSRLLEGSVAEYVLKHSEVPVLTTPLDIKTS